MFHAFEAIPVMGSSVSHHGEIGVLRFFGFPIDSVGLFAFGFNHKLLNALFEHGKGIVKSSVNFRVRPYSFGRIRGTPMQLLGLTGEKWTAFTSGLITHRNDEMERLPRQFIPGLATRLTWINAVPLQSFNRLGMDRSCRMTTGT